MISLVFGFIFFFAGIIVPLCLPARIKSKFSSRTRSKFFNPTTFFYFRLPGFLALIFFGVILNSTVNISQDKVGHLKRIYFGEPMAPGQIVALPGQKGPQAEVLSPGFQFIFMVDFLYDVEELPVEVVPKGHYCIRL